MKIRNWKFLAVHAAVAAGAALGSVAILHGISAPFIAYIGAMILNAGVWFVREYWDHNYNWSPVLNDDQVKGEWMVPSAVYPIVMLLFAMAVHA